MLLLTADRLTAGVIEAGYAERADVYIRLRCWH